MTLRQLLAESRKQYALHPDELQTKINLNVFANGAVWMHQKLHDLDHKAQTGLPIPSRFTKAGLLKYGISLLLFSCSVWLCLIYNIYFLPFCILVFYLAEVHFLFLFPIMLDGIKNPFRESIRATYKIGFFRAFYCTLGLAAFMLTGLFRFKNPLFNWHLGCMAVLIWYRNEVRDRL